MDTTLTEGDTLRLRCAVSSSLRPFTTVWWLHNATSVVPTEFLHVSGKHLPGRVAPDIISGPGPGRNLAIFSYPARPDMAAEYEAGFDHILIHLLHCLISLKNCISKIQCFSHFMTQLNNSVVI